MSGFDRSRQSFGRSSNRRGSRGRSSSGRRDGQGRDRVGQYGFEQQGYSSEADPPSTLAAQSSEAYEECRRELDEQMAALKIDSSSVSFAHKPTPGTSGHHIQLLTNFFRLDAHEMVIHRYQVVILPFVSDEEPSFEDEDTVDRASRSMKRINHYVFDEMVQKFSSEGNLFHDVSAIYDGDRSMFTAKPLPMESEAAVLEVRAKEYPHDKKSNVFRIWIKNFEPLEIFPQEGVYHHQKVVQALDIMLRYGPSKMRTVVDFKLYRTGGERIPLSLNKELAFGFYQSVRNCESGLMINVDRAIAIFNQGGNLLNAIQKCLNKSLVEIGSFSREDRQVLMNELNGIKFEATHLANPRRFRIIGFSLEPASDLLFTIDDRQMSVADYFKTKKRINLHYPHLPCVMSGRPDAPKYFPLEVCRLMPDQCVLKRPSQQILREMAEIASSQRPNERFREIKQSVETIKREGQNYISQYGIQVDSNYAVVPGRILEAPAIQYGNRVFKPTPDCAWLMQKPKVKKFLKTVPLTSWVIVNFCPSRIPSEFANTFAIAFHKIAKDLGLEVAKPIGFYQYEYENTENLRFELFDGISQACGENLQLIVCFLPSPCNFYNAIKYLGDCEFGVPTQCLSSAHYTPDKPENRMTSVAYLTNLVLKINPKIGGINSALGAEFQEEDTMVLGVDVTHAAGLERTTSIAACVSLYGPQLSEFGLETLVQSKEREEIVDLAPLVEKLLQKYTEKMNGAFPKKIIVFRDGVSEYQFLQVMGSEIKGILEALKQIDPNIKLTYVVVQKRHNTRFITQKREDATRNGNVPPGTTVDSFITDPRFFNYLVCSHNGQLGTSRPSRYCVLVDQNNYSADDMHRLSYHLCFNHAASTRSISLPIPVYYAHLAAYRARSHLQEKLLQSDESLQAADMEQKVEVVAAQALSAGITVHSNLQDRLHYL